MVSHRHQYWSQPNAAAGHQHIRDAEGLGPQLLDEGDEHDGVGHDATDEEKGAHPAASILAA